MHWTSEGANSPLHGWQLQAGHLETVVQLLLQAGADKECSLRQMAANSLACAAAASRPLETVAQLLLQAGADKECSLHPRGKQPLHLLQLQFGHLECRRNCCSRLVLTRNAVYVRGRKRPYMAGSCKQATWKLSCNCCSRLVLTWNAVYSPRAQTALACAAAASGHLEV